MEAANYAPIREANPEQNAAHQTGHNSGVIHTGLYYKPGSLKACYCVESREVMYRLCGIHGIPHERCGKPAVAICAYSTRLAPSSRLLFSTPRKSGCQNNTHPSASDK
jgi:hypothetical protein